MRTSILYVWAAAATVASAAALPAPPMWELGALIPKQLPKFFANGCNLANAQQPTTSPPLPAPASGLTLATVAIGRGTQNYTCADSSNATLPVPIGAVANLYNASCVQASYPGVMAELVSGAYSVPRQTLANMPNIGQHFFVDSTTPSFNLDTLGFTELKKVAAEPAPANTRGDVPWLQLQAEAAGTTSDVQQIYRLQTVGGSPPATCFNQPATIEVQYAAEYWFYV